MITSKLIANGRTTIPQSVRAALRLQPGDKLAYEIAEPSVILTKARRRERRSVPFGVFVEWNSEADTKGYGKL